MNKSDILEAAQELDRDLRAVRQALRRPAEAEIARGNLTGPQKSAMSVLVRSNGLSLKELSKELGLSHSTVSGIVDRLARQGMVKREPGESDRRFTKIAVTEPVREFLRETWPHLTIHPLAELLGTANPSDRQLIMDGVRTLRKLLEQGHIQRTTGREEEVGPGRIAE